MGEWKQFKISNPDYYEETRHSLRDAGEISFEFLTMDKAVLFNNVWVGSDLEATQTYANIRFVVNHQEEDQKLKDSEKKTKDVKKGGILCPCDRVNHRSINYPMIIVLMVPIFTDFNFLSHDRRW